MLLPQTVTATNANTITLIFATPTSGNAIISKGGPRIMNGLNDLGNGSYQFTGSLVITGDVDAQNFNTTSDIRLKTNLEVIEGALHKVEQLNAYTYDWISEYNDDGVRQIGLISQEVQKVLPEVVAPAPIDDKYLTVRYERLVPLLIEAIKELRSELDELKAKQ